MKARLGIADISMFVTLHTPTVSHLRPPVILCKPGTWHTYLCQQRAAKSQGIGDEVSMRSAMACLKGSGGFSAVGSWNSKREDRGQVEMNSWHMAPQHSSHKG